jgi:toxin ParE1/3/4
MRTALHWTVQAREDLLGICELIGVEQPAAAERYFDRIEAKTVSLTSQPRMGIARPGLRQYAPQQC